MMKNGHKAIKTNGLTVIPAQRQFIAYGKMFEFEVVSVFNLKLSFADDIASLGNQSKPVSDLPLNRWFMPFCLKLTI